MSDIHLKRMSVAVATLLTLALVIIPLAGCAQQPAATPTKAPEAPTQPPAAAPTKAPEPTKAPVPTPVPKAAKEVVIGYSGPLSGAAAEYGKDCLNGIDMAVNEINEAGGIEVGNYKVKFKLEALDDKADPTQAVNNARRFRDQNKAVAVFNPVFTGIAPTMQINEEPGNEFLMMAYTSTPQVTQLKNKLVVEIPPPFTVYVKSFIEKAQANGWKKGAMVVTMGAYGDEWRKTFKKYWEAAGGVITADQPANYYTETDFSARLTAALAANPDFLLIGGPSHPTALVIEQARGLGFKGGFILIDQAKMDYIATVLKGFNLMENTIGVVAVSEVPTKMAPVFDKRYAEKYKKMNTWEAALNYIATHALALAMQKAGTADDPKAIRAAFPKIFPLTGDKFPSEYFGISEEGSMWLMASVAEIKGGKYTPAELYVWWTKTEAEFSKVKEQAAITGGTIRWLKLTD